MKNFRKARIIWITFALGVFLLATSIAQTLGIILVLAFGQDIELRRWDIFQKNYFTWEPSAWYTKYVNFKYHYCLNEQFLEGEVVVKKSYPDISSGMEAWGMPAGFSNGAYRLKVWTVLPHYPIPLLPDYNPFWATLPFWIGSLVSLSAYGIGRRLLLEDSIIENSTSQPAPAH